MKDEEKRNRLLLAVLSLSFISLGLPDAVLGVAWPEMRLAFGKPLSFAGLLISMATVLSVCSSLSTGFLTARLSTGLLITVCAGMTASAMFGYAVSGSVLGLLFFTLFFGLGQGAVDAAVNAYMSRHCSARHMNWIHCCWGIGASGGPLIMSSAFGLGFSWRAGYAAIGLIQAALAMTFLLSLGLWRANGQAGAASGDKGRKNAFAGELPGKRLLTASLAGVAFYFLYPGIELVTGLWGASYLVERLGASSASAGVCITLFWGCLALGRFLAGFPAARWSDAAIIRGGLMVGLSGAVLFLTGENLMQCGAGLMLVGLGIAPLYPTMMHDTLRRVGDRHANSIVGFQVGAAQAGGALIPPAVGLLVGHVSMAALGPVLCLFLCLVLAAHEISLRNSLLRQGE